MKFPRHILIVLLPVIAVITATFVVFEISKNPEISIEDKGVAQLNRIKHSVQLLRETDNSYDAEKIKKQIDIAEEYLDEAQHLTKDSERYILIEKISTYEKHMENAIEYVEKTEEPKEKILEIMIQATSRHISLWRPLYHYIHPEAQSELRKILSMLEENHTHLLKEITPIDATLAGSLATKDLEYYIADIRKSAARRNSDFIRFSYEDYLEYRAFFDELAATDQNFLFGFATTFPMVFDDLYEMHEEIDQEYSTKTRTYIEDMRLELRETHASALDSLGDHDDIQSREALERTLSTIKDDLETHLDWRQEIHDIINDDYRFYTELQSEFNEDKKTISEQ
jgi:hypothetical protein